MSITALAPSAGPTTGPGVVVEQGAASDVLTRPQHPYTQALIAAVPGASRVARPPVDAPVLLRLMGGGRAFGLLTALSYATEYCALRQRCQPAPFRRVQPTSGSCSGGAGGAIRGRSLAGSSSPQSARESRAPVAHPPKRSTSAPTRAEIFAASSAAR